MEESYILASGQHFRLPAQIHQTLFDDSNLKPVHRELYLRLLMKLEAYNNANNFCQNYYPCTIEKICTWFNQSAKTIREHVHHLTKHRYIEEEGITKLNKNRPILIGVRFITDNFMLIENEQIAKNPVHEKNLSKQIEENDIKPILERKKVSNNQEGSDQQKNMTKAQILKKKMDELNNPSVNKKQIPQVNENVHPRSTKKDHNNQIRDQIKKSKIDNFEKIDLIKRLQKREDVKKITLPQFDKILERFLQKGILLAKDILFKVLCQMQFDMNKNSWKTPDHTHRLNGILKSIGNDINNYKVWVA